VSNIRNHLERQLPTQLTFPEIERNMMLTGWGGLENCTDGRILNCLANGCLGAIMSNLDQCSAMHQPCDGVFPFILQLYQLYKCTDDTDAVAALWPAAVRAFEWEMQVGLGGTPLPRHQCMAYDIIDIFKFDHVAYNAILYQAALRALIEMASDAASPSTFNASLVLRAKAAAEAGLVELNRTMWAAPARGGVTDDSTSEDDNNNGTSSSSNGNNDSNSDIDGYFRAWYDAQAGSPPWLQVDTMVRWPPPPRAGRPAPAQ
jgi:hypothetical protein